MGELDELVEKARKGDRKAEEAVFERLLVRFTTFAKHRVGEEEARDIAQEACMTVLQKYRDETFSISFKSWAYGILKNKIGNYLQKAKTRSKTSVPEIDHDRSSELSSPAPDHSLRHKLFNCWKKLALTHPRYARVLNLIYQGYHTEEICQRLRITSNNFYVSLNRGRSMLKGCLETGRI